MVPWMSMDVGFGQSNIGKLKSCERMSLRRCIGLNLGAWLEAARFLVGGKIGSKYLGVEIPAPTLVVGIAFRRAGVVVDELA